MSRRTARIESQLLSELAQLVRQEVTDPRVGLVTLTRADVSPDLANATIFWSALDANAGDADLEGCQEGLESAASFLRHRAARVLPLRRMPALHFRYDPSLVLGTQTLSVLRDVSDPDAPDGAAQEDARTDSPELPAESEGSLAGEDRAAPREGAPGIQEERADGTEE